MHNKAAALCIAIEGRKEQRLPVERCRADEQLLKDYTRRAKDTSVREKYISVNYLPIPQGGETAAVAAAEREADCSFLDCRASLELRSDC